MIIANQMIVCYAEVSTLLLIEMWLNLEYYFIVVSIPVLPVVIHLQ